MGTQTARNARETTCEVALDRSNYWVPALYHETDTGSFEMVEYEWSVCFSGLCFGSLTMSSPPTLAGGERGAMINDDDYE